jgi:hypothetical protein
MAAVRPDLSIDPEPSSASVTGLTGQGHIRTSYHALRERFGEPDRRFPHLRNTGVWVLDTPAGYVNLRRGTEVPGSAGDRDVESAWMIMATTDAVLPWIYKTVTGSTATFPAGARRHFSESTLASFANAYIDYLYVRMKAELEARPQLDRSAPDFWTHFRRPQQLNNKLLAVAEVVHHYEWWLASPTERAAWAGMGKPVRSSGQSELAHWREVNRWLYAPIATKQYRHGGDPDLPGMLRRLADTALDHRAELRKLHPDMDFELDSEHEQTLRALADTPIPGIDALSAWGT